MASIRNMASSHLQSCLGFSLMVLKNSFIKQAFALTSNSSWVQGMTNFAPQQHKTGKKEKKYSEFSRSPEFSKEFALE